MVVVKEGFSVIIDMFFGQLPSAPAQTILTAQI